MTRAALDALRSVGRAALGGVAVAPEAPLAALDSIEVVIGDHPLPGPRSLDAANAVGRLAARTAAGDDVLILLSGGATSLMAAPLPGMSLAALRDLFTLLGAAGLDIATMNAIRRRFVRWGGGRLAEALEGRRIRVLAISDVPGDDPSAIGSGPCLPDPLTAREVMDALATQGLARRMPADVISLLDRTIENPALETPKPGVLGRVAHEIILSNRDAVQAAADEAIRRGFAAVVAGPLEGEASAAGRALARRLLSAPSGQLLIWGGETTVTLGPSIGRGGRCQELALAAAMELRGAPATLLAAGTDGRDGPTDAAGAIVDGGTAARIASEGIDPDGALAGHDAWRALDAAGALLRPGPTGTNVMDVAIGLRGNS